MIAPETGLALCRLLFSAAAIVLYGAGCFFAFLAPLRLGREISAAAGAGIRIAGVVSFAASLSWLPVEAAVIGGGWPSAIDGPTLSALAFHTMIGTAWMVRVGLALLAAALFIARPRAGRGQAMIAAALLASLALSGHAEMNEGARRTLHILNDGLHLLAGGFWLGSLIMLPACLARLRDPVLGGEARTALRRFSQAGHVAVALVIATGIVNSALILGRWPDDPSSPYQSLLDVKIILVLAMTGLAVLNRYYFVPRLKTWHERAVAGIRTGTLVEIALGAGVLALVAVFGLIDPSG
ncbi:copper homeostasis membrane protein CopD [Ancylobacter sp. TS-1]|uniref:copper homeostasis membrane protein CopD n=1 Tax=Ancylobacter sp. TS-1 TaxID=1850374 RepID=UPI001390A207|nr:copper homeostasis membrane protein CopD [Ancylobacter sp. TS-1]